MGAVSLDNSSVKIALRLSSQGNPIHFFYSILWLALQDGAVAAFIFPAVTGGDVTAIRRSHSQVTIDQRLRTFCAR
jgi:hypothetical protein